MKGFVTKISLLILFSVLLCEVHIIILKLYPETGLIEYALWLDKNHKEKITIVWYIYELSNILNKIIFVFAFSKVAILISNKLFRVLMVFFFYYVTQFIFYIWDRNTVLFSNFIVYLYMSGAVFYLLIPSKKGGKLINIEDYY